MGFNTIRARVHVKFHHIDFSASRDMAKTGLFSANIGRLIRRGSSDVGSLERARGERFNYQLDH